MGGALDRLLVVAIEQAVAAPLCTQRLADGGARIIKIERAEGETARHYDRAVDGVSAYFAWLNRGKESVVLDLKDGDDIELVRRMVGQADVFVQNLAPGATVRLGLGAGDLVARHPRLVAVDIVGYGQETAYRDKRAYDLLVQAESGVCAVTGSPEAAAKVGVSVADIATGMNAHAAILEALLGRERTGRGRAIEIAMFDGLADWMTVPLLHWQHQGRETARQGLAHAAIYPYGPVACRDGALIVVVQNAAEWRRFCEGVLGRPELVADPRFADNPARVVHREVLDRAMAPIFAGLDRAEAVARLEASQLAWGRVSGVAALAAHPALRRASAALPDGGRFEVPRPAGRPNLPASAVPGLGAQTDRIRAEFGR